MQTLSRSTAVLGGLALLLCAPVQASNEDKRAFEITDVYGVAQVGVPRLSPDGHWIAFAVERYDVAAAQSWSEIWRMRADGSEQRQLTSGRKNDSDPRFSPDGRTLSFSSDRSGASQLWTLSLDGGEARQLTDFPAGVDGAVWSPDGKWIAVASELWPDAGIDVEKHKAIETQRAKGKLDVHVADELLYRHWTAWKDGRVTHVLLVDAATGAIKKDLTPGRWDSPAFEVGGGRGYDFAPDSKHIVFTSKRDANAARSTNSDLWLVPIDGEITEASATLLTADNDGWDGAPLFSPDGKQLAFLSQATPGYESDLKRLAVLNFGTKVVRYLTQRGGFDDMVTDMRWTPDSRTLFFQAEVKGRTPLFRFHLNAAKAELVHTDSLIDGWEVAPDVKSIVYMRRAIAEPHEIFGVAMPSAVPRRLTQFNAALEAEVDLRPAEEMWFDGDGDYKVHAFVITPHGFDPAKRYPLLLNVHGGPQMQWADAFRGDWQVYPGKGYVVAFCNPTGSTGYGQDFCDAIACDWGGRVYRDLMKVTDELEKLPYVDKNRIGAMGWSFGGYMMMWFQGHTDRFKCQASMMGLYDLRSFYGGTEELWFPYKDLCGPPWTSEHYEKWSPSSSVASFKTPSLVITGEVDYRVPYTQSLQYFTALQERAVPSRLVVFPNAGHWPGWQEMLFYYDAHLDWFHRWLGGDAAPEDPLKWAQRRAMK